MLRSSILRMVAEAFPALIYGYPRTYRVVSVASDKRLNLAPPDDAPHLPALNSVEQWGLGKVSPAAGDLVTVIFRDADPARPVVVHFEFDADPDAYELEAGTINLGENAAAGVARQEDTVTVLLTPATFTGTIGGSPASGMILWTPPQTTGTITTSSAKVNAE